MAECNIRYLTLNYFFNIINKDKQNKNIVRCKKYIDKTFFKFIMFYIYKNFLYAIYIIYNKILGGFK
ncbi:MAG: hypothetical protein CSA18_04405 [Deltaproteobacteria bacterium]|nr:MAG: hypothetical protein CSA18_04405 [Deltaproteobacteria bacterium]